jgi:carbamoyltransferase
MKWLGIGGEWFHDAGITLLDENGNIEFATLAERYSGKKHDSFIPQELLKTYMQIPNTKWMCHDDWNVRLEFRKGFFDEKLKSQYGLDQPPWKQHPALRENFHSTLHHHSHAAAAFMTRPQSFDKEDCVMVVIDGIGEFRSVMVVDSDFNTVYEQSFPKSIGYTYANFTDRMPRMHLKSNEDEYVTMGFSCYGEPTHWKQFYEMFQCIPEYSIEEQDGWEEFNWADKVEAKKIHIIKMCDYLFQECSSLENAAASLQRGTEELIYDIMVEARKYGKKLCYSGGVAQNIMANSRIRELFDDVWIDVNPGDGGASLGAAAYHYMKDTGRDRINWEHPFHGHNIEGDLAPEKVVDHLMKHQVCGVANGPAEFSYRAYGNRSLIADVRYDVKDTVNEIKQRQKYRPFAPAILEEHADEYFTGHMNRWMQYTSYAKHDYSSVTHTDGSARVQLVDKDSQSVFRKILECYYDRTGIPMLLNTSLNIRGKPMVNDEQHAQDFETKYGVKVFTK